MSYGIGFVGLGRMGSRMCVRLVEAGHAVTVHDVSQTAMAALAARGATVAASATDVANAAELVFTSLPTPAVVETVAHELARGSRIHTFVDLSTTGPKIAAAIAEMFGGSGIAAIDAPVSGGIRGAEQGTLSVMASGPRAAFEKIEAVLKRFGTLFYMGEKPGLGQTMKLVNNLLGACAIAITAEGMAMGVKAGLDPRLMIDVLNVSSGRSSATLDKWPRAVLPRSFDFGFSTALSFKDVRLCMEEAEAMGVPMIVGSAVRQMLSITNNTYGPDSDFTMMAKLVEDWAGLSDEKGKSK